MTPSTMQPGNPSRMFWTFRVLETVLLLSALVGMVMFAVSIVDILRIETSAVAVTAPATATAGAPASEEPTAGAVTEAGRELPSGAWPGIFVFFGSLLVLQPVRAILVRYRRDDGTQRDRSTDAVARATAEALASAKDDPGPMGETIDPRAEG